MGRESPLTILVQNRLQTEEIVYSVDEKTGATTELLRENDPAWLNLQQSCPRWLKDGSGFLWLTERTGQWSLELHRAMASWCERSRPRASGSWASPEWTKIAAWPTSRHGRPDAGSRL